MAKFPILVMAAVLLGVIVGCQTPFSAKPPAASLASSPLPPESSFDPLGKTYHGPLLQSHGTADRLIPNAMGRQLFAAANEPKQFVAIPGGDHNDPQTDAYYVALFEFLGRL